MFCWCRRLKEERSWETESAPKPTHKETGDLALGQDSSFPPTGSAVLASAASPQHLPPLGTMLCLSFRPHMCAAWPTPLCSRVRLPPLCFHIHATVFRAHPSLLHSKHRGHHLHHRWYEQSICPHLPLSWLHFLLRCRWMKYGVWWNSGVFWDLWIASAGLYWSGIWVQLSWHGWICDLNCFRECICRLHCWTEQIWGLCGGWGRE